MIFTNLLTGLYFVLKQTELILITITRYWLRGCLKRVWYFDFVNFSGVPSNNQLLWNLNYTFDRIISQKWLSTQI